MCKNIPVIINISILWTSASPFGMVRGRGSHHSFPPRNLGEAQFNPARNNEDHAPPLLALVTYSQSPMAIEGV